MKNKLMSSLVIAGTLTAILSLSTVDAAAQNGWEQQNGNWVLYQQGNQVKDSWAKVKDSWYHFDANGNMQTGWLKDGGVWYYLSSNGDMKTGWFSAPYNGRYSWYYADNSGAMQTGWIKDASNRWYSLRTDGTLRTEWYKEGNTWYYLGYNGDMKTGWTEVDNKWSYFNADGSMVSDMPVKASDGYYYMIGKDGYMVTKVTSREFYHDHNGADYYIGVGGRVHTDTLMLQPHVTTSTVGGYDLLKELVNNQEPDTMIDLDNAVKNIQNHDTKFYFGPDGKRMMTVPEVNIHSDIAFKDGQPYIANYSPRLDVMGHFTIVNNKLFLLKDANTGTLRTGYYFLLGQGTELGYNLLIYANSNGEVVKMKRLSKDEAAFNLKEMDGLNDDFVVINMEKPSDQAVQVLEKAE